MPTSGPGSETSWLSHVLRWPTGDAREWAVRAFPQLCADNGVVALVLLGSTIRPADSSFDLDCLYVFRGARPAIPRPPADVDIRGVDSAQVDHLIADGHDLLTWSLRLGRLVCEKDSYWSHLRDSWLERLPFPSAVVADQRAKKAEKLLAELRIAGDDDAVVEQLVTSLTHRARAVLLRAGVFPASRPELPAQLRQVGAATLADALASAIRERTLNAHRSALVAIPRAHDAA